jgi:deoxyribose-phosphate aldolase
MLVAKSSFKKPLMKLQAYYDSVWYGFMARKMITDANSNVEIGTVIDFPEGSLGLSQA